MEAGLRQEGVTEIDKFGRETVRDGREEEGERLLHAGHDLDRIEPSVSQSVIQRRKTFTITVFTSN